MQGSRDGLVYNIHMDKQLGKGAFAQVYIATLENPSTKELRQKEFAIKVVNKDNLTKKCGQKGHRNLQSEVNILSIIKHRNIVRLEDFTQTAKNYYIIFEYCDGGDLQRYLKTHGSLSEFAAQSIVYQLA